MEDKANGKGGTGLTEQLRRERILDMERRFTPYRRYTLIVLGMALLLAGPWVGWWWIVPLTLAGAAFTVTNRLLVGSPRPELWGAAGWAVSPLMIAISVALTGGADSPALYWLALPAGTLAARFERGGMVLGGAYVLALLLASTVPLDPAAVVADPVPVGFAVALVIGAMLLSIAAVDSDRHHRETAVVDPLTGLLNRAALAHRVADGRSAELAGLGRRLGLLIGDLDHFKRINDELGHAAGDAVLRDVAYAIRGALRSFDAAYRIGGEEFLVLLPDADEDGVAAVGERLRAAVRACSRSGVDVSMSFGGAVGVVGEVGFDPLNRAADDALYVAKRSGRNRVCMASAGSLPAAGLETAPAG